MTFTDNGNTLWALLQAAANQEGGLNKQTERYSRFVKYDVTDPLNPVYLSQYVVPLPLFVNPTAKASKNPQVAAQSEIHALPNGQFFVLSRDSNNGHGASGTNSTYRHIDVFDISQATDIKDLGLDCATCAVANPTTGVLNSTITPALYCSFLDFNVNAQLNRFGLHNGGAQDSFLLVSFYSFLLLLPLLSSISLPHTPSSGISGVGLCDKKLKKGK